LNIIKTYYATHFIIVYMFLMTRISKWIYEPLYPLILNKYYNYSEQTISYSWSFYLLTFSIVGIYISIKMENKLNYVKWLIYSTIGIFLSIFISALIVYYDLPKILFILMRSIEGGFTAIPYILYSFMIKATLKDNSKNGTINSFNESLMLMARGIIPIIMSAFLIISGFEIFGYFLSAFMFLSLVLFLIYNKKKILFKYQKLFILNQGKQSQKNFFTTLKDIKNNFNKDYLIQKTHYIILLVVTNLPRPFYNLYMLFLLTNTYGMTITKAISISTFMLFGMASTALSGFIVDRVPLFYYRIVGIFLYTMPLILIISYPNSLQGDIYPYLIFYLFGLGRSFDSNYDYKLQMKLINNGVKINHINLLHSSVSEISRYVSYLISSIMITIGFTVGDIFIFPYIMVGIMILMVLSYDFKYLRKY